MVTSPRQEWVKRGQITRSSRRKADVTVDTQKTRLVTHGWVVYAVLILLRKLVFMRLCEKERERER